MTYYIMMPGDTEKNCINDANILGESSFNIFWAASGLKILMNISEHEVDALDYIKIVREDNKILSVEEFLLEIDKLEVRIN